MLISNLPVTSPPFCSTAGVRLSGGFFIRSHGFLAGKVLNHITTICARCVYTWLGVSFVLFDRVNNHHRLRWRGPLMEQGTATTSWWFPDKGNWKITDLMLAEQILVNCRLVNLSYQALSSNWLQLVLPLEVCAQEYLHFTWCWSDLDHLLRDEAVATRATHYNHH